MIVQVQREGVQRLQDNMYRFVNYCDFDLVSSFDKVVTASWLTMNNN